MSKAYEYRHTVAFEETNLVGNVYYVNHMRWQGRCREMFLKEHSPDTLAALQSGLILLTTFCSCEYLSEISAFDEIVIRMRLGSLTQNRMTLMFEYYLIQEEGESLFAKGEQRIACMRKDGDSFTPAALPESLERALNQYR
ncbi:MAG: acyl-CoA thioesterase [candidate division Zixibacteria bacterium]|nr:acyl-CoA thioesterase [candidate division Zixibacteria bacterium]